MDDTNSSENKSSKEIYLSLPIVYSCSGCSSAAQLANKLAIRLDRSMLAEMSCIAGVGGNVKPLVKVAQSGRKILALDGCPLHCAKKSLESISVSPTIHIDLSKSGIKKRFHEDASLEEESNAWNDLILPAIKGIQ